MPSLHSSYLLMRTVSPALIPASSSPRRTPSTSRIFWRVDSLFELPIRHARSTLDLLLPLTRYALVVLARDREVVDVEGRPVERNVVEVRRWRGLGQALAGREQDLAHALPGRGRDRDGGHAVRLERGLDLGPARLHIGLIDLVERHHLRLLCQVFIEQRQLGVDLAVVGDRVRALAVEQVDQHARALHMPQEVEAEPDALMRALD